MTRPNSRRIAAAPAATANNTNTNNATAIAKSETTLAVYSSRNRVAYEPFGTPHFGHRRERPRPLEASGGRGCPHASGVSGTFDTTDVGEACARSSKG
jgi:hypothetical protein